MSIPRLLNCLSRFENARPCRLPRLLILTDAARGFDLATQRQRWPKEAAFIERTFGEMPSVFARNEFEALQLATTSARFARRLGLNGIHWPHKMLHKRQRSTVSGLIETASAHSGLEIARVGKLGMDGVLVSAAFASHSPSARAPLGPVRLAILARRFANIQIFALGGITHRHVRRLETTGVYGVAVVSLTTKRQTKTGF